MPLLFALDQLLTKRIWQALMAPRSERLLIEEVPLWQARPGPQSRSVSDATSSAPLSKPKKATRRLSDFMTTDSGKEKETKQPSVGSKRDIWLIYLTDVVIRCQRTGVTQHPIGAMTVSPGKKNSKDAKKRNLYKFIQVERWEMRDMVTSQKGGMVSMEEVAKYRHSVTSSNDDAEHIAEEEGGLGGRSRMSYVIYCLFEAIVDTASALYTPMMFQGLSIWTPSLPLCRRLQHLGPFLILRMTRHISPWQQSPMLLISLRPQRGNAVQALTNSRIVVECLRRTATALPHHLLDQQHLILADKFATSNDLQKLILASFDPHLLLQHLRHATKLL